MFHKRPKLFNLFCENLLRNRYKNYTCEPFLEVNSFKTGRILKFTIEGKKDIKNRKMSKFCEATLNFRKNK